MMRIGYLISILFLARVTLAQQLDPPSTYTIIAPNIVRPNTDYMVAVSLHNTPDVQDVTLRITGRANKNLRSGATLFTITQSARIQPDETQFVRLRIGELGSGHYSLTAYGTYPLTFNETKDVIYIQKGYSVFIQTDKSIYRPGHTVRFRAVIISPRLKPTVVGSIDVFIRDGKGNLVTSWKRVFTTKGVFAAEMSLAKELVMGDWNITVSLEGQLFWKSFQVAEYVLPKFDVSVDLPDYGTFSEGDINIKVHARNILDNRPVKGEATIAIFPRYKSSYLQPIFSSPIHRVVDIFGEVSVTVNLAKELNLNNDESRDVVFDVTVVEEHTKRLQNITSVMRLHKHPHKLELIKTADAFKPGMPFIAYLNVLKQSNYPIQDKINPVIVKWGFGLKTENYNVSEYIVPDNGIIQLNFMPPTIQDHKDNVLGIEATYKDLHRWFSIIPRSFSPHKEFLQAQIRTRNIGVGSVVEVLVKTTIKIASFTYHIFGRGSLIFGETQKASGTMLNTFTFRASRDMSPVCRIIIYYVNDVGEIIADSVVFQVKGAITNPVTIFTSKSQVFVGKDVTINVRAKPNSYVGILAIHKSVERLQSGNDISREDIFNELRSYDTAKQNNFYSWYKSIQPQRGSLFWHSGSSDSKTVFKESGTIIMTNGILHKSSSNKQNLFFKDSSQARSLPSPIAQTLGVNQDVIHDGATRPPLAGPYAFSRLPRPVNNLPKIYLRNDLPETWLFTNVTTDAKGRASLPVKAPILSNSSWVISGFALNELNGFGITNVKENLEVFQPFYVEVDLPFVVKKDEIVAIEMVVYNYLSQEIKADVTLENSGKNTFVFAPGNDNKIVELFKTRSITVKPGRGTITSFLIIPMVIGDIDLKITAQSSVGQDILIEKLRVEAEGEIMYKNEAFFLDLRNTAATPDINVSIKIPKTSVANSEQIYISAIADPIGSAMNNLGQLIRYPTGSGEQNLIRMIPQALIADYLRTTSLSSGPLYDVALKTLRNGYQQQLTYRLDDGSFSAFGEKADDKTGSVWITALVTMAMRWARLFIDIDGDVIDVALNWLIDVQSSNGAFSESGRITHKNLQESTIALTAFVVSSFLAADQDNLDSANIRNTMNRGLSFIANSWQDVSDPYELAIVTYVLQKASHPLREAAYTKLQTLSVFEGNKKWWERSLDDFESGNPWRSAPNSINIEMTSYVILTILDRENFEKSLGPINWLLSQQNSIGGFASTPDTYVAIHALVEFSKKLRIPERGSEINLQYTYLGIVRQLKMTSKTPTIIQKHILPMDTRNISLRSSGGGVGLLQVGYQYNLNVTGSWPSFIINPQVFLPSTPNYMQVTICLSYVEEAGSLSSNLAVMEVNMPSGFKANRDALPALLRYKGVKRVDIEEGDSKIILYFEALTRFEVCPTISAFRTHRVARQKPALVLVYDYYDQSKRARSFYEVSTSSHLCDICQGQDCHDFECQNEINNSNPVFGTYLYGDNIDRASGSTTTETHKYLILSMSLTSLMALMSY